MFHQISLNNKYRSLQLLCHLIIDNICIKYYHFSCITIFVKYRSYLFVGFENTIYLFYDWKSCHLFDHIYLFFKIYLLKSCQVNNRDVNLLQNFMFRYLLNLIFCFEVSNVYVRNQYFNMICDDSHHEV